MIIELIGLPGAGKSCCEAFLCGALRAQGKSVVDQEEAIRRYKRDYFYNAYGIHESLSKWRVVRGIAYGHYRRRVLQSERRNRRVGRIPRPSDPSARLPCIWLAEDMLLCGHFQDCITDDIFVMSEGLAHHLAAVRVWNDSPYHNLHRRWLDDSRLDDLKIVHIDVPWTVAFERLWERGIPRSWPKDTHNRVSAQRVVKRFYENIPRSIEEFRAAGAHVVSLKNNDTAAALRHRINDVVCDMVKSSPPTPVLRG